MRSLCAHTHSNETKNDDGSKPDARAKLHAVLNLLLGLFCKAVLEVVLRWIKEQVHLPTFPLFVEAPHGTSRVNV